MDAGLKGKVNLNNGWHLVRVGELIYYIVVDKLYSWTVKSKRMAKIVVHHPEGGTTSIYRHDREQCSKWFVDKKLKPIDNLMKQAGYDIDEVSSLTSIIEEIERK